MLYCQLKLPGIINPDVMDILALLVFEKRFETFGFFDNQAFVVASVVSHCIRVASRRAARAQGIG
jgi:hypothetical protein